MNNRIVRTKDGRVYYCATCPYRDTLTGFCGFCMRKILDEAASKKMDNTNEHSLPVDPTKEE